MFPLVAGNKDKYFVSMPLVTPASSSTTETTNYSRLCRVLVDLGTSALRDCFDSICTPPTLHTVLAANQPILQNLRSRRIINATQWGKLFPAIPTSVSSKNFDITLLMTLLRNICGLAPPMTGWDVLPAATDTSCEADIARVKYFRNVVYAHAEHASIDDSEFHRHWKDIRDTLVRLGGVNYEVKVCYYSCCCCFYFFSNYKFSNLNTYIINLYIYLTTPILIFVAYFLEPLEIGMGGAGKAWE